MLEVPTNTSAGRRRTVRSDIYVESQRHSCVLLKGARSCMLSIPFENSGFHSIAVGKLSGSSFVFFDSFSSNRSKSVIARKREI